MFNQCESSNKNPAIFMTVLYKLINSKGHELRIITEEEMINDEIGSINESSNCK